MPSDPELFQSQLDGTPTPSPRPLEKPDGPDLEIVKGPAIEAFARAKRTGVGPSGHGRMPVVPWRTIALWMASS